MIRIEGDRDNLYQWDLNQRVILTNIDFIDAGIEVHFSCTNDYEEYCPTAPTYFENGNVYADIPNKVLQRSGFISVYLYVQDDDKAWTEHRIEILIIPRKKPANYVYTETEVLRWETLEEQIKKLNEIAVKITPQELIDSQRAQARVNIGAISEERANVIEKKVETAESYIERESESLFDPLVYKYTLDRFGNKYDFFNSIWQPFPDNIEINTPILLYDLTTAPDLTYWRYSTFEKPMKTSVGQYKFDVGLYHRPFSSVIMDTYQAFKGMMSSIGGENFKVDYGVFCIYSIVSLDTLNDEYQGMFSYIGVYYVCYNESFRVPARIVWTYETNVVSDWQVPSTIARTADVEADLDKKVDKLIDDETITLLVDEDMLPAVHDTNGKILTDNDGNVILRY